MNAILIVIVLATIVGLIIYSLRKASDSVDEGELVYDLDALVEFTKLAISDFLSTPYKGNSDSEFSRREQIRKELRKSLSKCMHGSIQDKLYVKSYIKDLINRVYEFDDDTIDLVIPFMRQDRLTSEQKFMIMLHHYKKEYGVRAFAYLVDKYGWLKVRDYKDKYKGFWISHEDIQEAFDAETEIELSLDDKLDIVVQFVYQKYVGLGVIDEIRDQRIDGINGGASGIPSEVAMTMELEGHMDSMFEVPKGYDSIWVFFRGFSVYLMFLSFGSDQELKRICQNIYTYGSPGQLNESNGHKINEMADRSRVLVVAPKLSDNWTFFVRKFDDDLIDPHNWFKKQEGVEDDNSEFAIETLKYLARGVRTIGFTGQTGTGKTTLMRSSFSFFYDWMKIRVQEGTNFELWLRKAFPYRNIVTFREIEKVSGAQGLVINKKSDGDITIIGEIADDETFSLAMKAAQVASLGTWFSHHAQTAKALVDSGRDALVSTGFFSDEALAEEYVASVLKFNVHLENRMGHRHIARITEYIPVEKKSDYPDDYKYKLKTEEILVSFLDTMAEYFFRKTDRVRYETRDILVFENGRYVPKHRPSERNVEEMKRLMLEEDRVKFEQFLDKYWGKAS